MQGLKGVIDEVPNQAAAEAVTLQQAAIRRQPWAGTALPVQHPGLQVGFDNHSTGHQVKAMLGSHVNGEVQGYVVK